MWESLYYRPVYSLGGLEALCSCTSAYATRSGKKTSIPRTPKLHGLCLLRFDFRSLACVRCPARTSAFCLLTSAFCLRWDLQSTVPPTLRQRPPVHWGSYWTRYWPSYSTRYWPSYSTRYWTSCSTRYWTSCWASYWPSYWTRYCTGYWTRYWPSYSTRY